jgi:hypothetical protein
MKAAILTIMRLKQWGCTLKEERLFQGSLQMKRRLSLRHQRVCDTIFLTVIDKKPGAPPGKDDKGKKPGEEVISPEEKERLEKEAAAREERQAAFTKQWEEQTE